MDNLIKQRDADEILANFKEVNVLLNKILFKLKGERVEDGGQEFSLSPNT